MWLCVGLEVLIFEESWNNIADIESFDIIRWHDNTSLAGLPGISDAWFVPGFIESDCTSGILAASYAFVKHLYETEKLRDLIALYTNGQAGIEAGRETRNAWKAFVGCGQNDDCCEELMPICFLQNQNKLSVVPPYRDPGVLSDDPFVFNITEENGKYYFEGGWTLEAALEYANVSEAGLIYAKEWLNHEYSQKLTVVIQEGKPVDSYGAVGAVYLGDSILFTPYVEWNMYLSMGSSVHEAAP